MTFPATDFREAVALTITASNQLHQVINGSNTDVISTVSGDIPALRKALLDNFYFVSPINWVVGEFEEVFNQVRIFTDGSLWFAPSSTQINPVEMTADPYTDDNWKIFPLLNGNETPVVEEEPVNIVMIGDSLSEQTERGPSLVNQLETYLTVRGANVRCYSPAVGGSTFEKANTGQINTSKTQTQADIAVDLDAKIVCVAMGFNDAFNTSDSALDIIQEADALFNDLRTRLPNAHIVYIEEVPYDRVNISSSTTGLTNKNVMPFLQEGKTLFGQPNVFATNDEFLNSQLSGAKIARVDVWNQVTDHIKSQSYIDSTMEFDMFFLARCGMHTDLIHLDVYGYKMFALDIRKHFMNTPDIIDGITNSETSELQVVYSDSDDLNPNILNGTSGLRNAFNVVGTGVNSRYEFIEDFVQIGFTNHDYYPFASRQYIWPFRNRNICSNLPSQAAFRNVPIAFDITNAVVGSDVFINWDDNNLININRVVDSGCSILSINRLNSFFPVGNFGQGSHTISYAMRSQDGRIEMYERPIEIINSGDDPNWVVGGGGGTPGEDFDPTENQEITGNYVFLNQLISGGGAYETAIVPGGGANNSLQTFASSFDNSDPDNPVMTEGGVVYWNSVDNSMNIGRTNGDGDGVAYNLKILPTGRAQLSGSAINPVANGDIVTKGYADANYGGGSAGIQVASYRLSGTVSFSPSGGTQFIPVDTLIKNTDPTNLIQNSGQIIVSASAPYTEFRVKFTTRVTGVVTGTFAAQATVNGQLPSSATTPIIGESKYSTAGEGVWFNAASPWIPVSGGGDIIQIEASGPNGGTVQGGYQTWLEVEAR